jgi:hypothetical protein
MDYLFSLPAINTSIDNLTLFLRGLALIHCHKSFMLNNSNILVSPLIIQMCLASDMNGLFMNMLYLI